MSVPGHIRNLARHPFYIRYRVYSGRRAPALPQTRRVRISVVIIGGPVDSPEHAWSRHALRNEPPIRPIPLPGFPQDGFHKHPVKPLLLLGLAYKCSRLRYEMNQPVTFGRAVATKLAFMTDV
jgi:hypothetical protein